MIQVTESTVSGARVLRLAGKLDAAAAPSVEKQGLQAIQDGSRRMVLSLGEVEFISSAGLRAILNLVKKQSAGGGVLALCGPTPAVQEILKLAAFDTFISIYPDEAAALEAKDCRMPGKA